MTTETILTDDKIKELFEWHIDDPEVKALSFDFARAIEQAVLAKLAEQEPRVPDGFRLVNEEELIELSDSILGNYYRGQDWERERITNMLKTAPCVSPASDKTTYVSEKAKSESQTPDGRNIEDLADALYTRGYMVGGVKDWDPRGRKEWQDVVDAYDSKFPEGWQLVPDQLNDEMAGAMRLGSRKDYPSDQLCEVRYAALLAAAPKYTGESK